MDAERTSLDSSGEVASFEGLLEELDDLRARLLDQYKREIAQQPQSRTLTAAPSVRLSIAARPDIPTLLVPDSSYPSPRASQASGGEPQGTLRVSHAGVAPKSSIWSRASLSPGSPAQDQEVIKWCQSERFHLLDSWRNKVPAAKLAEFEPEPQKGRPAMSLFSHIVRQSSRLSVKLSGGPATTRLSSGPFSAVLVHPQSPLVTAWSIFSLVLIAYDTVTVPLFTFYRFERFPKAVEIMDWVARAFWTMDIPLSSATGFHTEGYVEMRPRRVFQAYLTSWFLFDLFVISADWLWVALYYQTALSAMSVMRGLRLVRVLRLLRLRWFTYLIDEVLLWLCDGVTILVRLVKLTGGLCITVHLLASIWFGLGTISSAGWVSQEPFLDSAALLAQYTMSLSWVVTQLHGTSLVRPQTLLEIQFQTLVLLIAYAFAAVFMASMVQLMMAITNAQSLQMQYICRRYLRRRRISPELSHKLQLHFGRMGNGTSLEDGHEEENRLVESLPLDLQRQLYEEVRLPLLSSTRLFRTSGICNYRLLRRLCCDVLSGVCQKPGEVVFTCGDSCSRMLVVESGTGVYTPVQATRDSASMTSTIRSSNSLTVLSEVSVSGQKTQVQRGQCLCEASLWTWWTNRGELSAEGDCTMLAVDQEGFASVVSSHESSYMATLRYASCYVLWLNERSAEQGVSDLMDTPANLFEYAKLLTDRQSTHSPFNAPFVFISHFKEEAGSDAALMEEGISRIIKDDPSHPAFRLETPAFLDSNNLNDLRLLRGIVRSSHNLLLLLTDRVLERPWVLIEIVTAMKSGVPIQLVLIQRPGVDFKFPTADDIKQLAAGRGLTSDAKDLLKAENVTASDLEAIGQIFGKIALPFSPHRSLTVRQAELHDIISRCDFGSHGASSTALLRGDRPADRKRSGGWAARLSRVVGLTGADPLRGAPRATNRQGAWEGGPP